MKKSPLSTPSGSIVKHGYGYRSREEANGMGYGQVRVQNVHYTPRYGCQRTPRNDFIPLNANAWQNEQNGHARNRHGWRGQRYYQNSNSSFNGTNNQYQSPSLHNSYSPYKQSTNTFRGRNAKGLKGVRRQANISSYVNLRSFLEDPWAELVQKMEKPEQEPTEESKSGCIKLGTFADQIDSEQRVCSSVSLENLNDSGLSPESRSNTLDESLALSEQDASQASKMDSSVDLKFDEMKFTSDAEVDASPNNSDCVKEEYNCLSGGDVAAGTVEKCK